MRKDVDCASEPCLSHDTKKRTPSPRTRFFGSDTEIRKIAERAKASKPAQKSLADQDLPRYRPPCNWFLLRQWTHEVDLCATILLTRRAGWSLSYGRGLSYAAPPRRLAYDPRPTSRGALCLLLARARQPRRRATAEQSSSHMLRDVPSRPNAAHVKSSRMHMWWRSEEARSSKRLPK